MKYGISLFFSLFLCAALFAQPANDACVDVVDLGAAPACPTTVYTNVNATASDLGQFNEPSCFVGGAPQSDVWFTFTPSDTIEDYRITITGVDDGGNPAMIQPQVAIYRGSCGTDMLFESVCSAADPGSNEVTVDFFQPDLGLTYYIRVDDFGANGAFNICVEERPPVYTIDEGGAQSCSGFLYDTGGENGNYGNNEDHVFTICPNQPNSCIKMAFEFYNFEAPNDFFVANDFLTIWDNDSPSGTPIVVLDNFNIDDITAPNGGAVCFEAYASSGCMTLQFVSDEQVTFEGFSAFWECSQEACPEIPGIVINDDVTEDDLAEAIAGTETQLSVASLNCPEGHYGTFTGEGSELGLGRGIVLSSGLASYALGPNTSPGPGPNASFESSPGDADLDSLTTDTLAFSRDACILEVDVFSATDELVFEYVFGSEEYPEFVGENSPYNDIFAFLISGPGIVGNPSIGNKLNVASLPDGTPVEINSVNTTLNWQYYRNNALGQSIQYDGLTSDSLGVKKSLTARASVNPCETYRIKLAVADRGDASYNSTVFVSDIQGASPDAFFQFAAGVDYLVEDCVDSPDTLVIQLDNPRADSITYGLDLGGTASLDVDYTFPDGFPDSITFPPGFTRLKIPLVVLSDLIDEGTETIALTFTFTSECGTNNVTTVEVDLRDDLDIQINAGEDTILYCIGNDIELTATGATDFNWSPEDIFDDPNSATVIASPMGEQLVTVVGTFGTCTDSATVLLIGIDPMIEILDLGDTVRTCPGDTLTIFQENNINNNNIAWTGSNIIGDSNLDSLVLAPSFDFNVTATVELAGCLASDTVFVDFSTLNVPTVIEDTIICEGYPLQLASIGGTGSTTYAWEPQGDFDDPTDPNAIINPTSLNQTYTLISTSGSGFCADTQMVNVQAIPSRIEILTGDLVEVCAPYDSVVLEAVATPLGSDIVWSPNVAILNNFGDSISVNPPVSVTYVASYTANGCFQSDTVTVKVDSLPQDMSITLDTFKDPYCQGDTFRLISPIYDVGDFSSITHMWMDAPGLQTGDSLYNGFVIAQDTSLFFRVTENGACRRVDSVQVNVVTPPLLSLTPMDTSVCLGSTIQYLFEVVNGAGGTVEWTPDDGSLSCTDCIDPLATINAPTSYTVEFTSEGSDCSFPISANVSLIPPPSLDVIDQAQICPGAAITPFLGGVQFGTTYRITGPGIDTDDPLTTFTPTEDITLTYTAEGICETITATSVITIIDPVEVSFDAPAAICSDEEISLTATTTAPAGQEGFFTWSINGEVAPDGGLQNFTTFLPPGNTTVSVTYTNSCETVTATQIILVEDADSLVAPLIITTDADGNPVLSSDRIFNGETIILTAFDSVGQNFAYTWQGNGEPASGEGEVITVITPSIDGGGQMVYSLTYVSPIGGCTGIRRAALDVEQATFVVPNHISPNFDGVNDGFGVLYNGAITEFNMLVFNRWGQLVYETNNPDAPWDGNKDGEPQVMDAYFYKIRFIQNGIPQEVDGQFSLVR